MGNDDLESFLRRASNYHGGAPEYYEDTHDEFGNYKGYGAAQSQGYTTQNQSANPVNQGYGAPQNQSGYAFQGGGIGAPLGQVPPPQNVGRETEAVFSNPPKIQYYNVPAPENKHHGKSVPLPKVDQYISPRLYQNIVLYSPRTSSDVERLIDYLRRREPAIVDLDPIADTDDAQRVLDFTSGAVYALNGRIIAIKTNMFLIVPEGIDVAKPEVKDNR